MDTNISKNNKDYISSEEHKDNCISSEENNKLSEHEENYISDKTEHDPEYDPEWSDFIELLGEKLPSIIGNSHGYENVNTDVTSMMKSIEQGEEPIMLKICSGRATEAEIDEWIVSQGIDPAEKDEVLSMLLSSFSSGIQMAENMTNDNDNQISSQTDLTSNNDEGYDRSMIITKLNHILLDIDKIKSEVFILIQQLQDQK